MKLLKMIVAAVALIALIIGTVKLTEWLGSDDGKDQEIVDPTVYQAYLEDFTQQWSNQSGWNDSLFADNIAAVNSVMNRGEINDLQYTDFRAATASLALDAVRRRLERDYRSAVLPVDDVNFQLTGLDRLSQELPDEPEIKDLRDAYDYYRKARKFADREYSATQFATGLSGAAWTPFSVHKDRVVSERNRLVDNKYYKRYFSNNLSLAQDLNAVDRKVEALRPDYLDRITNAICARYRAPNYSSYGDDRYDDYSNIYDLNYRMLGNIINSRQFGELSYSQREKIKNARLNFGYKRSRPYRPDY